MEIHRPRLTTLSPAAFWSGCAGIYIFLWGIISVYLLNDILTVFVEIIGLPPPMDCPYYPFHHWSLEQCFGG